MMNATGFGCFLVGSTYTLCLCVSAGAQPVDPLVMKPGSAFKLTTVLETKTTASLKLPPPMKTTTPAPVISYLEKMISTIKVLEMTAMQIKSMELRFEGVEQILSDGGISGPRSETKTGSSLVGKSVAVSCLPKPTAKSLQVEPLTPTEKALAEHECAVLNLGILANRGTLSKLKVSKAAIALAGTTASAFLGGLPISVNSKATLAFSKTLEDGTLIFALSVAPISDTEHRGSAMHENEDQQVEKFDGTVSVDQTGLSVATTGTSQGDLQQQIGAVGSTLRSTSETKLTYTQKIEAVPVSQ